MPQTLWRCPQCGRRFKNPNQWHSCVVGTAESHLQGKPPWVQEAFQSIVSSLQWRGELRMDAVEAGVNLAVSAHFGALTPQQSGLSVEFLLRRRLGHPPSLDTRS